MPFDIGLRYGPTEILPGGDDVLKVWIIEAFEEEYLRAGLVT